MWFIRHKIKVIQHLAVTETDWSPFCGGVCVCVFVYTIVIGLIQKLTEVLIDILNTNIKSLSHKVQTLHFDGDNTTRVRFFHGRYVL